MKREVKNYAEFEEAVNNLFGKTAIHDVASYNEEITASKNRRKQKLQTLSERINHLKEEIKNYRDKIKQAIIKEDKKEIGIRLNKFITLKQELVKTYKEEKNSKAFTELSKEAQIYACTQSLFKKYLFASFVQTIPNSFKLNDDQSVTVDVELFRNSEVYQQAQHIKDYVSSYIEHYPHRVQGSRYFVGLHKNATDLENLTAIADEYFDKINEKNTANEENLLKSRAGIEVVEIYSNRGIQAVKLLTAEALQYEGREMAHCVASYASKLERGETELYSIRDYGDEYIEFIPHATIEYKDGKITQIKGYKDSLVDMTYMKETRLLAMRLAKMNTLEELMTSKDIPYSEKTNIGIIKGTDGKFYDILDTTNDAKKVSLSRIVVKSTRLKNLQQTSLNISNLVIHGPISQRTINHMTSLHMEQVCMEGGCEADILDYSSIKCKKFTLKIDKETNLRKIIIPSSCEIITLIGTFNELTEIHSTGKIKELNLEKQFNKLRVLPQNIEKMDLHGDFYEITTLENQQDLIDFTCRGKFPKLKKLAPNIVKLSLSGELDNLKGIDDLAYLRCLTLYETTAEIKDISAFQQLEELDLNEGYYHNLEKLDFSRFTKLKSVNFHKCTFSKLKEIIIPANVESFGGSHCLYPVLERLDISHSPYTKMGTIEQTGINCHKVITTDTKETMEIKFPILCGYLMNFSSIPQIKEIKLQKDTEELYFTGIHFGSENPINFAEYKKLKQLDLMFCDLADMKIDLSSIGNIKEIRLDRHHLHNVTLPKSIEELELRTDIMHRELITPNFSAYTNLKTLKTDFIVDTSNLPPSLEYLNIQLHQETEDNSFVKEFDFSNLKKLTLKSQVHTINTPNLKRIVLPATFEDIRVCLMITSSEFQEVDFTKSKGDIILHEMNVYDMLPPTAQVLHVSKEQFKTLKKIKLGKDVTDFKIIEQDKAITAEIELAYDMPQERKQAIRTKYPTLTITSAPFPTHRLLPYNLPQRAITR